MPASGSVPERGPLLAIEGVVKRFGGHTALAGVSLSIHSGEIIALAGENGAGKSVRAIVEGRMSASVAQRPFEMGRRSVEAALALIDGRTVEPRIDTGTELVTSANAAGYRK